MVLTDDPIVAIATAVGRASVGIIRVSGTDLKKFVIAVCGQALKPRYASYLPFFDNFGIIIDKGLAIFFPSPNSYTGEDVLELHAHGGLTVLNILLANCLEHGRNIGLNLRLATPGEFTRRAYLNDKLDLIQAEAVADLISANTERAVRCATLSLSGAFSKNINLLVAAVIKLRVLVEATLDFPEEEASFLTTAHAEKQLLLICESLSKTLSQSQQGAILREGLTVVLAGAPNVGKSSLLNRLADKDVAIVTAIAGTTRDQLQQTIYIQGIPVHIIDTAGLRDTNYVLDEVEKIGISRSWQSIATADIVLLVRDVSYKNSKNLQDEVLDEKIIQHLKANTPILRLWNKADLLDPETQIKFLFSATKDNKENKEILLSAKTGYGIDNLREKILAIAGWHGNEEGIFFARKRHIEALSCAERHCANAKKFLSSSLSSSNTAFDLLAEELRLTQECLNSITGVFTSNDLLGEIFSNFCIGK